MSFLVPKKLVTPALIVLAEKTELKACSCWRGLDKGEIGPRKKCQKRVRLGKSKEGKTYCVYRADGVPIDLEEGVAMITKERESELLEQWICEQNDSWREDCEKSEAWRQGLTAQERELVEQWDRETPEL